ncbi:Aerobic C4-dicarboxylate transport protein [Massilia sp. Bi118]|uniref:cation:dicarboxylate symporter family transporter n=1 Tax=Massilia sp. Bi118 TaxID=2822346 RepID=UPI001DBE26C9|nr:cation:dicarboxylase symporter family transporter [Massilia sp. Bi118]CAH0226687.1 Aerobic C4-dicarboxylate transport protein [Massilia sp. Bi118]
MKGFLPLAIPVAAGLGLGLFAPALAVQMQPLAQAFIHLLGWLTYPLIFCMLVSSASTLGRHRELGRIGALAFAYFALLSLLSMLSGLAAGWALEPGVGAVLAAGPLPATAPPPAAPASMLGWLDRLPSLKANNLLLLAAALPIGLLLGRFPDARVLALAERCRLRLFGAIKLLLMLAPLAAFGAMAAAVGRHGLAPLLPLLKFIAAINLASALFVLVVLGGAAWFAGMSLLRFIAYIRAELYLVFFTSSSLAGLVPLSEKLEGLGCPRAVTDVVLPFSYSLNLAGTYLYIAMGLVFLTQAAQVRLGWHELAWMLGVALISSKGAVGVAGSGVATLAATVALLHVVPPETMAILFAIDRTMKCRLLTNVIGHGVACVVVAASDKRLNRQALARALSATRPV